eukprot:CAMPEP_0167797024 /NCGR_PEP_ID=MMETSP0111_2-20121227/15403_1 /TAXON_ID=91324 /ORGANISM="Lotharella globosa, Strain CCCM811" /LENGTH=102 /DNA_ID=CAMNT_0007691041 /DNA_START=391 /DNA_END=699 /DNA_ORIENTATION=-
MTSPPVLRISIPFSLSLWFTLETPSRAIFPSRSGVPFFCANVCHSNVASSELIWTQTIVDFFSVRFDEENIDDIPDKNPPDVSQLFAHDIISKDPPICSNGR